MEEAVPPHSDDIANNNNNDLKSNIHIKILYLYTCHTLQLCKFIR